MVQNHACATSRSSDAMFRNSNLAAICVCQVVELRPAANIAGLCASAWQDFACSTLVMRSAWTPTTPSVCSKDQLNLVYHRNGLCRTHCDRTWFLQAGAVQMNARLLCRITRNSTQTFSGVRHVCTKTTRSRAFGWLCSYIFLRGHMLLLSWSLEGNRLIKHLEVLGGCSV